MPIYWLERLMLAHRRRCPPVKSVRSALRQSALAEWSRRRRLSHTVIEPNAQTRAHRITGAQHRGHLSLQYAEIAVALTFKPRPSIAGALGKPCNWPGNASPGLARSTSGKSVVWIFPGGCVSRLQHGVAQPNSRCREARDPYSHIQHNHCQPSIQKSTGSNAFL